MQSLQSSHPTVNPRNFQNGLKLHSNNIAPCHEDRWSPRHTSWRWEPPGKTFQDIGGLVKLFIQRERCQYPCVLICVNFISNIHYISIYLEPVFVLCFGGWTPPKRSPFWVPGTYTLYYFVYFCKHLQTEAFRPYARTDNINNFGFQVCTTCLHNLFAWFNPRVPPVKGGHACRGHHAWSSSGGGRSRNEEAVFPYENGEILYPPHPPTPIRISWET